MGISQVVEVSRFLFELKGQNWAQPFRQCGVVREDGRLQDTKWQVRHNSGPEHAVLKDSGSTGYAELLKFSGGENPLTKPRYSPHASSESYFISGLGHC